MKCPEQSYDLFKIHHFSTLKQSTIITLLFFLYKIKLNKQKLSPAQTLNLVTFYISGC